MKSSRSPSPVKFSPIKTARRAAVATQANRIVENIGARRLHSVIERIMEDISYNASTHEPGTKIVITKSDVRDKAGDLYVTCEGVEGGWRRRMPHLPVQPQSHLRTRHNHHTHSLTSKADLAKFIL